MEKDEYWAMIAHGLERDGLEFVLNALQEECAEVIKAVNHLRRGRCKVEHLVEEMADVRIMSDMAKLGLCSNADYDVIIDKKSRRLGKRIEWKNDKRRPIKLVETEPRSPVDDSGHYERTVRGRSHHARDGHRNPSDR